MRKRRWLPVVLLVLASLACSVFGRAGEAIEAGKEVATRVSEVATVVEEEGVATLMPESSEGEPADEEPATEEPADEELNLEDLSGLDSYRTRFSVEWRPEEGEPEIIRFEEAHTRNPSAQRMVMEGGAGGEGFELVQIEDKSWLCGGGACTQMDADAEELASGFSDAAMFDPGDMTDESNATFVGRETIDGVRTRHYTLNLTPMQAAFLGQGEMSDLAGEAWIADEPDLPAFAVRFEMSWTEKRQDLTGQASFVYETYDVNVPFTIEPPEGAEESGLPEDVPGYPNGEETFSMAGMTSFSTPDSLTAVVDFYRDGLAAEGWTAESDEALGEMVQQTWKKGDRTLTLIVSAQDEETTVMITIEE